MQICSVMSTRGLGEKVAHVSPKVQTLQTGTHASTSATNNDETEVTGEIILLVHTLKNTLCNVVQ